MRNLFTTLFIFVWGTVAQAQQTQIITPVKKARQLPATIEFPQKRFIPLWNFGTVPRPGTTGMYPTEVKLYLYNKSTQLFTDSVRVFGDTFQTDTFVVSSPILSCYANGIMYFLSGGRYFGNTGPAGGHLFYTAIDTNLNVLVPQRQLVNSAISTNYFKWLTDLRFHQDKLYALYNTGFGPYDTLRTSRAIVFELGGQVLKDTVTGIMPNINTATYTHYATQIIKEAGQPDSLYIAGNNLTGPHAPFGIYRTDTSLRTKRNYETVLPSFLITNTYRGSLGTACFSDIRNGVLFSAGTLKNSSATGCANQTITAIHKHLKANEYAVSHSVFLPNSSCSNNSFKDYSFKKLFYSEADQALYFAASNRDKEIIGGNACDTTQNELQVICVDTNLNIKWQRFVVPKAGKCAKIMQVIQPARGSGITIVGEYLDVDTFVEAAYGGFILYLDSAGTLDIGNTPNFTIRDRFTVYPNPAKGGFWVEDIAGIPAKAFLYDLAGRQVAVYTLKGRKNRLEVPAGSTGMLLLRVVPQWGEGWSQMVQVAE